MLDAGLEILRHEVGVPPIADGPGAVQCKRAGKSAFVKRHPGNHSHVVLAAGGKQFVLRGLIEDVVDDLHRVNQAALDRLHAVEGFPTIDADADGVN